MMDRKREKSIEKLMDPNPFRPDRRLVTIYTELRRIQTKIPYNFSLYSNAQIEEKPRVV